MGNKRKLTDLFDIDSYKLTISENDRKINSEINALKKQIEDLEEKRNKINRLPLFKIEEIENKRGFKVFKKNIDELCKVLKIKDRKKFIEILMISSNKEYLYYNIANPEHSRSDLTESQYQDKKHLFIKIDLKKMEVAKDRKDKIRKIFLK